MYTCIFFQIMLNGYHRDSHRFTQDGHLFKISSYNPEVVPLIWLLYEALVWGVRVLTPKRKATSSVHSPPHLLFFGTNKNHK